LEDAYRIAHLDLVRWLQQLTNLDALDAYQLLSQAGQAPVGNVVDPNYVMAATISTDYLITRGAYDNAHTRLRDHRTMP
jgi:acetamidase/formamidase